MKNKPKYKKTPFVEWKADKPDWQNQLIGNKILYGFNYDKENIRSFIEIDVLDYESTNNVFYISENGEKAVWRWLDEPWIVLILEEIEYDQEKQDTKVDNQKNLWEELAKLGKKNSPPETIPYIPPYNPRPRPWKYPAIPQPDYPPPNYPGPYVPYWDTNKFWCQYCPNENWSQS
jgi:hypothetical protein